MERLKVILALAILAALAIVAAAVPFAIAWFLGPAWGIIGAAVFGFACLKLITWSAQGDNIMSAGPVVIVTGILILVGLVAGAIAHLWLQ